MRKETARTEAITAHCRDNFATGERLFSTPICSVRLPLTPNFSSACEYFAIKPAASAKS